DDGHNPLAGKIRAAAALALKQLETLRSAKLLTAAAFRVEVGHISDQMLERYGCELIMHDASEDRSSRFKIHMRDADRTYDLIADFFHRRCHEAKVNVE
ncbi:MAG: hypothetical protein ACREIW_08650, partial [Chthoniobacterales bacterium]